jgi:hypothetical protein
MFFTLYSASSDDRAFPARRVILKVEVNFCCIMLVVMTGGKTFGSEEGRAEK